ncbi:acid protease [Panus rudis PR-1116 ss-1]|nr:acid protease [Panus rudis PR-1116 ss-1]
MSNKYRDAGDIIEGIGLNDDPYPDTYPGPALNQTNNPTHPQSLNSTQPSLFSASSALTPVGNAASDPVPPNPNVPPNPLADRTMRVMDYVEGNYDKLYYGPLGFGTPPQQLDVIIDTGSADLWAPVQSCRTCQNLEFNEEASSTYIKTKQKFKVAYATGNAIGMVAFDTVAMGGLKVQRQGFGAVTVFTDEFNKNPASGLLGLAFGTIAKSKQPTLFENMMSQRLLANPIFGIHLARGQTYGSELCFGCSDMTKTKGDTTWFPLVQKSWWTISMNGLSASPENNQNNTLVAAIDSGASFITVPENIAAQFYNSIPGSRRVDKEYGAGFYVYPCAAKIQPTLFFSGVPFTVAMEDFNLGPIDESGEYVPCFHASIKRQGSADLRFWNVLRECLAGIVGTDNTGFPPNLAIVGDMFLKSWYATFDYGGGRVGFAPSINQR